LKRAFTLIEMLVVIAILAMLASLIVPAVNVALQKGQETKCLANLRSMGQAVQLYLVEHEGRFPPALVSSGEQSKGWDFFISGSAENQQVEPGWIWQDYGSNQVLQCPTFRGSDNWQGESFTGYNYNASYLGGMQTERRGRVIQSIPSSRIAQVRNPAQCALFGDGEYSGGANKFMRSPFPGPLDGSFSGREGGTQGFRHRGYSHVVFVDGHVSRIRNPGSVSGMPNSAEGTGFLSTDNSLYDFE